MITIDGLVSGIDTATIVEGLLEIQQRQIDSLEGTREEVLTEQAAFRGIEARLLSFQTAVNQLNRNRDSVFAVRTVATGNESLVTAAATSEAPPGTYSLAVNSLARSHQIATQGFDDPDAVITQGTLTIQVGTGSPDTITVDSTNATLQGLADAINSADLDVAASVIHDGASYRLLLASNQTGLDNQISVTNNLAASGAGATRPDFDVLNPVQEAADASVTIGSGPGAIAVSSGTNIVDDVIPGVTLNLHSADPATTITLSVDRDTEPAVDAVQNFVDEFNALMDYIDEQVRFNGEDLQPGVLIGNRDAIALQNSIRSAVLDVVPGLDPNANRLTAIGVSVTNSGRLNLDTARLQSALTGALDGVSASDVQRLFALTGESTHPQVEFLLGSTRTQASQTPYQVDIIQAAERATVSAHTAVATTTVLDASNNTLEISLDGASAAVTLTAGTYTATELAAHLESTLNSQEEFNGRSVSVAEQAGVLSITSDAYGSSSAVAVTGGTALPTLGFSGTQSDVGQDVAGTFIVDGISESATGRGRILTGNADNEHTADLQLRVTLTTSQIVSGPEAEVDVTRGVASRLDQNLTSLLDPVTGRVALADDAFDAQAESIQQAIDLQQQRFEAQQQSLIEQFVALESALQQLQTTSSFLASQLTSLRPINSSQSGR